MKRTQRAMLLDDLRNKDILYSRKLEIIDTFPDFMYNKGLCFFAVNDAKLAERVLYEYMGYDYEKKGQPDYYKDEYYRDATQYASIFQESISNGSLVCHSKFNIPEVNKFMELLLRKGVILYDYDIQPYE